MAFPDSSAVELAPIRDMLRLYCRALSERAIDLQDLKQLVDKEIGWSKGNVATSDGAAIFLPAVIENYEQWSDNYDFLKVALTQQAGHIEFGSFEFEFTRPSTRFDDLRSKLSPLPEYHDHDHGHEGHHDELSITELTRLFKLFPSKRLALDVFSIAESARIEACVMREYRGIASLYKILRERALRLRPRTIFLPAREALLEFMARITLGQRDGLEYPRQHEPVAREVAALIALLGAPNASVEDVGEVTLRIYGRLAVIENRMLPEDGFLLMNMDQEGLNPSDRWSDHGLRESALPRMHGRDSEYLSPQPVDYRGEFRPELAQLLTQTATNAREERKALTADDIAELLRSQRVPKRRASKEEGEEQDPETQQMAHNFMRELLRRDPRMQSIDRRPGAQSDDDGGPLTATQPNCFIYDEWDFTAERYRDHWCRVYEKTMAMGDLQFYRQTLSDHAGLQQRIRREFEQVVPEIYRKEKRLPDGPDHDLDAAIEAITDLRIGVSPSEKVFWRHYKIERDVAVAFLLDMSGSTGEAIGRAPSGSGNTEAERAHRRIIDVEREAIVLMIDALEAIGDRYGVYGFSGHGRDNCEFYVIKDLGEEFSLDIAKRFGRIGPLHATRMGPAIRHAAAKLRLEQTRSKFLFLISDGRPQDRGYSQEGSDKAYALQDTRRAFLEARREGVHPFCLTVDKEGNDYLRTMMDDFSYEVLAEVSLLPERLPQLYKKLTT